MSQSHLNKTKKTSELSAVFLVFMTAHAQCVTYGKDMQEARAMAREAIELYLEDMAEKGEEVLV